MEIQERNMRKSPSKKIEAACLILAGGQGKRLTPDKPLLEIDGQPIIERAAKVVCSVFKEVLLVTNTPEKYEFLGLPHVVDERPGYGPLMGICSGLRRITNETAFVCAADMPFLNEEIIRAEFLELGAFDIVVPYPRGMPEFLHAFYRKRCLPAIRENLDADLFKIEMLTDRCKTRRLNEEWFAGHGWMERVGQAFTNINTIRDYRRWTEQGEEKAGPERRGEIEGPMKGSGPDALRSLAPGVLQEIRQTLIGQETAYQHKSAEEEFASLWTHSSRVGRIAHHIAKAEGWDAEPALLAGLLHDIGKFAHGRYHEDDVAEEEKAGQFTERILSNTVYDKWVPAINQALLSLYREEEDVSDLGRVVYDADRLDKLGYMGVAQFFAKNALRRHFLDDDMMVRASIELTYAHHAPDTLKTATGRALAEERGGRTLRFYTGLLEEWAKLGLGDFDILEEDIEGIACVLVVPRVCECGGRLDLESDIRESVKCRSAVVRYLCTACGLESEFSFCLPNVKGLPLRREGE
jgi:putative nucleotidyltransferase with HDIG domain